LPRTSTRDGDTGVEHIFPSAQCAESHTNCHRGGVPGEGKDNLWICKSFRRDAVLKQCAEPFPDSVISFR